MAKVLLSLGSNIGDSIGVIKSAIADIGAIEGVTLLKTSSMYRTKPVGFLDQDDFINAAVSVETNLDPELLLKKLLSLELDYKRVRLFKDGPRTLDIDIIAAGDSVSDTDTLILPHPRMHQRAFVLAPLSEIEGDFFVKALNATIFELYDRLPKTEKAGAEKLNG